MIDYIISLCYYIPFDGKLAFTHFCMHFVIHEIYDCVLGFSSSANSLC